jgi:hypothetical protein
MDEELIGQRRELGEERTVVCDLCGKPTTEATVVVLERRSSGAPDTEARVCPDCRRRLAAGELPVEPGDGGSDED